ncbi:MAG: HNH endonuclease [Kofleriaceae bacterium]
MSAVAKLERWQVVHEALVDVAVRRSALDADEMRWLYEAEQIQIWKQVGAVSMVDYLERVLHYAPRTAQERMRVARALADLPALMDALSVGELSFSAIKELARVATRATERVWCDAARGKNLREVEQLVSERKPGDLPTDLPDDEARLHTLRFEEISASGYALFRQARQAIDRENGSRVTDDQLVQILARAILDGAGTPEGATPIDHGRAQSQIHYTVCQHCDRAWQHGGGERVRIDAAALAQVRCDAVEIPPAIDGTPQRASQTIPPATRREIFHRDQYRCQTSGCRSTWGLEIHHIVARADEGTHETSNLTLRCSGCHTAHHEGKLTISGTAPDNLTTTRAHALSTSFGNARVHHRPAGEALDVDADRAHVGVDRHGHPETEATITRPHGTTRSHGAARSHGTAQSQSHGITQSTGTPLRLDAAITRTNAIAALTTSGWKRGIAVAAVDAATAHVGAAAPLDVLLREAFRRCPTRPSE